MVALGTFLTLLIYKTKQYCLPDLSCCRCLNGGWSLFLSLWLWPQSGDTPAAWHGPGDRVTLPHHNLHVTSRAALSPGRNVVTYCHVLSRAVGGLSPSSQWHRNSPRPPAASFKRFIIKRLPGEVRDTESMILRNVSMFHDCVEQGAGGSKVKLDQARPVNRPNEIVKRMINSWAGSDSGNHEMQIGYWDLDQEILIVSSIGMITNQWVSDKYIRIFLPS